MTKKNHKKASRSKPSEALASEDVSAHQSAHQSTDSIVEETPSSKDPLAEAREHVPENHEVLPEFPFKAELKQRVPQLMALAEATARNWQKGGDFSDLPIRHPLSQALAAQALKKAKETETKIQAKVDSSGIKPMAQMGLEYLKSKIKTKG